MKFPVVFALMGFAISASVALAGRSRDTPITRVVKLLKGLQEKLEKDMKDEEALYENYICWAKSVVTAKTASNKAAEARVSQLEAFKADIEAGKVEFTTERVDREKEIQTLSTEIEQAQALRDSEKKDYEAAKEEMDNAIDALEKAIEVISEGMESKKTTFAEMRSIIDRRWKIEKAMQLSRGVLSESELKYLHRAMNGQIQPKDWEKKATFKMKYKGESSKIVETLQSLLFTFKGNLKEATEKEEAAAKTYSDLKGKKEKMLKEAQDALTALKLEMGARGMNKEEAAKEMEALKAQVTSDEGFISATEADVEKKKEEFKLRTQVRQKELTALSQAISVLASDDARDLFTKSFKSQGYSFVQLSSQDRVRRAAGIVAKLAAASPDDAQLALLAELAKKASLTKRRFGQKEEPKTEDISTIAKVVEFIDVLIGRLDEDEKMDLDAKEKCEADLSATAGKAKAAALEIDEKTESIAEDKDKITTLEEQIEEQKETIASNAKQLEEAKKMRQDEKESYEADKLDDMKAVQLIKEAYEIMKNWNKPTTLLQINSASEEETGSFAVEEKASSWGFAAGPTTLKAGHRLAVASIHQSKAEKHAQPVEVEAGEAPPPPPKTWEGGYSGATGEGEGVLSILSIVQKDVEKDIELADQAEKDAVKAFEKLEADLADSTKKAGEAMDAAKKDVAVYEGKVADTKTGRTASKDTLAGEVKEYSDMKPGCDFTLVNYKLRVEKRQIEKDGLIKAKTILKGGKFD